MSAAPHSDPARGGSLQSTAAASTPQPPVQVARCRHRHREQLIAAAAAVVWLAGFVQAILDAIFDQSQY